MKPSIFKYLDYRKFLKDAFEEAQRSNPSLSYLSFAKQAGYTSPNLLQLIIQRKRKLTGANILSTARLLKLKKRETEYFQLLVAFDQAGTHDERDHYLRRILRHPGYAVDTLMTKSQYRYFEKWYYPIVRELVTSNGYNGDPQWIVRRIFPRITAAEVKRCITLLQKLHLIFHNKAKQKWEPTDNVIRTPREVSNLVASLYHKKVLDLAGNAVDAFGPDTRDMRAVTLKLSPKNYAKLKKKFNDYWNEVLALAALDDDSESVYQVHFALFPLTKKGRARK
jgi:uncharacterized protein (TIGR02147 family)